MSERIRWEDDDYGNLAGYVGAPARPLFKISRPVLTGQRRALTTTLPDWLDKVEAGSVTLLKSTAEAWLEEFVSSLGAVFGDVLYDKIETERDARQEEAILAAQDDDEALQAAGLVAGADALGWVLSVMDRMKVRQ